MLESLPVSDWLHDLGELAASRDVLEAAALQLLLIGAIFGLAWGIRAFTCSFTDRLAVRLSPYLRSARIVPDLRGLVTLAYAWLLLVLAERLGKRYGGDLPLVGIAASLTALWIVLRLSAVLFRDTLLARFIATLAWILAALDITGLLAPTAAALDSAALTLGSVRVSLLMVIKAVLIIAVLLWAALALSRLIAGRIEHLSGLTPSIQVLARNLISIALVSVALLIGLDLVGIDLTALAVFSGAVGVGLGFGLQKIVSNFVSGIILLVERSIKPGDVIEVGHTYGSISALGARYVSVRGRDGKEYLIPNEMLITNQVTNWSYSSPLRRLDVRFGVGYDSDLRAVRQLAIDAASRTKRVIASPAPVCHITEFGDNSVNLLLRFWIEDPANGVVNVTGDVYLALWEAMRQHGIAPPNPARDIVIRELPAELAGAARTRSAAE